MHGAQRATPTPSSTGSKKTTTIHDDCMTVFAKRAKNSRRTATGVASSSRRSSERKNVESAVTTPLNARKERKVRKSHERPMRSRKSPSSSYASSCVVIQKAPQNSDPNTSNATPPKNHARMASARSLRRMRLRDDQYVGRSR